jgi:hypothetical protein
LVLSIWFELFLDGSRMVLVLLLLNLLLVNYDVLDINLRLRYGWASSSTDNPATLWRLLVLCPTHFHWSDIICFLRCSRKMWVLILPEDQVRPECIVQPNGRVLSLRGLAPEIANEELLPRLVARLSRVVMRGSSEVFLQLRNLCFNHAAVQWVA